MLIERRKFGKAQELIGKALSQYPDSADIHSLQAYLCMEQDQYEEAFRAIGTAIACAPDDARLFYLKARIHLGLHDDDKAEKSLNTAISLDPQDPYAFSLKAVILLQTERAHDALKFARLGLSLAPENSYCKNVLSAVLIQRGQSKEAEVMLREMLYDNPTNADVHAQLGQVCMRQAKFKSARQHFQEALTLNPNDESARTGMQESIKSANWLYRQLMKYTFWLEKYHLQNSGLSILLVLFALAVLPALLPFVFVLVAMTWYKKPVGDMVLYFDQYTRFLLEEEERKQAAINLRITGLALVFLFVLAPLVNVHFAGFAYALFACTLPIALLPRLIDAGKIIAYLSMGCYISLGMLAMVIALQGGHPMNFWIFIGLMSGILSLFIHEG